MDIEKQVKELKAKNWNVECKTIYLVQERSVDGISWYDLGKYGSLEDAMMCKMCHFKKWYGRAFDSIDQVTTLRIVMRHTVEVVL